MRKLLTKIYHFLFGYECPECGGVGLIMILHLCTTACPTCDGKGRVRSLKEVK